MDYSSTFPWDHRLVCECLRRRRRKIIYFVSSTILFSLYFSNPFPNLCIIIHDYDWQKRSLTYLGHSPGSSFTYIPHTSLKSKLSENFSTTIETNHNSVDIWDSTFIFTMRILWPFRIDYCQLYLNFWKFKFQGCVF